MPRAWTWRAIQRLKRSWSARGDREAGLVFVPAGEVVGLDRVEALARAHRDPRFAAAPAKQPEAADVEPALVREAFVAVADHRPREAGRRRAGSSPSCRRRGSRSPCGRWRCSARTVGLRRFEAVDVVDRGVDARCRSCPCSCHCQAAVRRRRAARRAGAPAWPGTGARGAQREPATSRRCSVPTGARVGSAKATSRHAASLWCDRRRPHRPPGAARLRINALRAAPV